MARNKDGVFSVSHSEMGVFKECRRRWMLQYHWKLRRKYEPRSKARDTGILVHGALEVYYKAGGARGEGAEPLMYMFLNNARDEDLLKVEERDRKNVIDAHDTAEILCRGYLEWLAETGADIGLNLNLSEAELRIPGPIEGTEIMGIVDLGGTDERSGDIVVMDTKVTNSIDDMMKSLHIMEQGPMYAMLAKVIDGNPNRGFRVIWNMVKRSKQTARSKPPHYARYELAINADQLRQFYAQLHGQISDMLELERRLNNGESHIVAAYPTPTKDCTWKCPYIHVCSAMTDPRTDAEYIIDTYFTTPEQRAAAKIDIDDNQQDDEPAAEPTHEESR